MTATLPIANIVTVSLTDVPSGVQTRNVNNVLLLTKETPNNVDPYGIYYGSAQVAADYGTNSQTYKDAQNIFAQSPNILSGGGSLVIAPMQNATSATSGTFTTADISANVSNFANVADGDLQVTLNGTVINLTGLNFNAATSLSDIAAVIGAALQNCEVSAGATGLEFVSKKVGATSAVELGSVTGGSGTDISGSTFLNASAGTAASGVDSTGESVLTAVNRLSAVVNFCGVVTNLNLEDAAISTAAAGIQSLDNLFLVHFSDTNDLDGEISTIQQATQKKTRSLLYTGGQSQANDMKMSYTGRAFSVVMTGSGTASTMHLKTLANITPDPTLTQTEYNKAATAGADLYVSFQGLQAVQSNGGNDFFDNQYSDLAIKFAVQAAAVNYLAQTNTKIPQTEAGMNGLKAAVAKVMRQFVNNGYIAPGTWNSEKPFGNSEAFGDNIQQFGYYIYSQPIATQAQSDRSARKAPLIQVAIKRAGAIHSSDIVINVEA